MVRRIISARYLALALLAAAQLSIAVHAAEHGVGQHTHDGVPCLYGATNDNDTDATPPHGIAALGVNKNGIDREACVDLVDATSDLRIPPATGPPGSA